MRHILQYQIDLANGSFGRVMQNAQNETRTLDGLMRRLTSTIAVGFGGQQLLQYGKQAVETSAKVEGMANAIKFASGSEEDGAKNLAFLTQLTDKHGSSLMAATAGYKTFLGSMQGAPFTMGLINKMFTQVDMAAKAMNLSGEDSQGVYLALGQIMGKGKVQAEELRGQIGERIPGAFAIAARAMGVSQQALNKMMEDGKLMSNDFLPKFAAELERTFGSGLAKASQSFQSEANRRENALLKETQTIGTKLQPAYLSLMDAQLKGIQIAGSLVDWISKHEAGLKSIGVSLVTIGAAYAAYNTVIKINTLLQGANILGNKALVASQLAGALGANSLQRAFVALNVSMAANPWAWALAGVAALAGGLYYYSQRAKQAAQVAEKQSDVLTRQRYEFNGEMAVLARLNPKNTERKNLIDEINRKYGEYLPKALTEKSTIEEIAKAQEAANAAFKDKIYLMAREEALTPLIKQIAQLNAGLNKAEVDLERIKNTPQKGTNDALAYQEKSIKDMMETSRGLLAAKEKELNAESAVWDKTLNGTGVKKSGNTFTAKAGDTTQSVSSTKSVRNVMVNMDALVKQLTVYLNAPNGKMEATDIKSQLTKLLVGIVNDAEQSLA